MDDLNSSLTCCIESEGFTVLGQWQVVENGLGHNDNGQLKLGSLGSARHKANGVRSRSTTNALIKARDMSASGRI